MTLINKDKKQVCVDFDGVLAQYDKWEGEDVLGAPIPGAREFLEELSKTYRVIIFTVRCGDDGGEHHGHISRIMRVSKWLKDNNFPYDEVYCGVGKPFSVAYVDDRAVTCRPQEDDTAFTESLKQIKELDISHGKSNYRPDA